MIEQSAKDAAGAAKFAIDTALRTNNLELFRTSLREAMTEIVEAMNLTYPNV